MERPVHARSPMDHDREIAQDLEASLQSDPRIAGPTNAAIRVTLADRTATLEGEVGSIASKRRAVAVAELSPRVRRVVDAIRVLPAVAMGDAEIRDHVCNALLGDGAFAGCAVFVASGARAEEVARSPGDHPDLAVHVRVAGGIVTLAGRVPSLVHRRVAEALCWWVPGTRNVANDLEVTPPELDSDAEIREAIGIVLEKEPFVDAAQLAVRVSGGAVTLAGAVRSEEQRRIAEHDVWFVRGVRNVENALELIH